MQTENLLENILPALCGTPKTQMSSKEFQRTLYTWFEEKGLVSDLRSYLRVLMINELRKTAVGKIDSRTNFSLSKQAFSLLIAEHLLREGCHYTLSIFSTEVPGVANQLPFSLFEAHSQSENWRFDQESLVNVLELVGISKGSGESRRIVSEYLRNEDSLLTCLVNSKGAGLPIIENENDLYKILTKLGVPPNVATNMKRKIEDGYLERIPIERRQMEEMREILSERNNQIKVLLDVQIAQKKDNKKLKNELKQTQQRLKQALLQEKSLNLKETHMREKLAEVTRLQRSLEKSLSKEKVGVVCSQKHCAEFCQNLVGANEELKNEMSRLEESNNKKNLEIERLHSRISSLMKDLQNSKLNIEFLNTCLLRSSQIDLHQGEERVSSSEDSSENLTGEILKQVRSKLQQLEKESDDLDVKFKKLKMSNFVTK